MKKRLISPARASQIRARFDCLDDKCEHRLWVLALEYKISVALARRIVNFEGPYQGDRHEPEPVGSDQAAD